MHLRGFVNDLSPQLFCSCPFLCRDEDGQTEVTSTQVRGRGRAHAPTISSIPWSNWINLKHRGKKAPRKVLAWCPWALKWIFFQRSFIFFQYARLWLIKTKGCFLVHGPGWHFVPFQFSVLTLFSFFTRLAFLEKAWRSVWGSRFICSLYPSARESIELKVSWTLHLCWYFCPNYLNRQAHCGSCC